MTTTRKAGNVHQTAIDRALSTVTARADRGRPTMRDLESGATSLRYSAAEMGQLADLAAAAVTFTLTREHGTMAHRFAYLILLGIASAAADDDPYAVAVSVPTPAPAVTAAPTGALARARAWTSSL